ncbi:peptidoglycan amidohydrolase family protein [Aerococcaceae bacterium WGS1372]
MASRTAVIQWYLDREGKISYAKTEEERLGPDTYDSASAMFSALIAGYFLPYGTTLGTMSFLYQLDNVLLYEISRNEIQAGDIFIAGFRRDHLTENAYTGVALDFHRVIYCIESADGIVQSTNHGWPSRSVKWYRLTEPTIANNKPRRLRSGKRIFIK